MAVLKKIANDTLLFARFFSL